MTLDAILGEGKAEAGSWCSCYGVKMTPYFSENAVISQNEINLLISESFLTVKGAALFLPRGNGSTASRINHRRNKHAGDLQQHLQAMFTLLRPEDNIRLAVRLESVYMDLTRYMVVVSTNGRQDTDESIVLGMDFYKDGSSCTMGLVLPLWSDTLIHLDGDGGFSVSTVNRIHIFKPVSVQAMWSALQSLHKACEVARTHNYYPGSLYLTWISYYENRINSNQTFINEWNAMQDLQSHRPDSPVLFTDIPTERELTERQIKSKLREIMMQRDLENVTSKEIRTELEMQMVCNLREFKEYIDNEMVVILRQMDNPTEIFEHVYLGSEWNASNLEDLQNRGIRYILNITREIDNFFPGMFEYHNIRVYDEEVTDLLAYWNDTYKFITRARNNGSKCLVHCKMGISRSASTVIAYAMKEYGWNLDEAYTYVKEKRAVTKPNSGFMRQLEEYQGILLASKQRHNKLWRSHSDSDLSDHRINKSTVNLNRRDSTSTTEMSTDPLAEHLYDHQFLNVPSAVSPRVNEEMREFNFRINAKHEKPTDCNADPLQNRVSSAPMPMAAASSSTANDVSCTSDIIPLQNCHSDKPASPQQELTSSTEQPVILAALGSELKGEDSLSSNCISLPLPEAAAPVQDHTASPELPLPDSAPSGDAAICSGNADRIDFFSAREKFIELSQESGVRVQPHVKTDEPGGCKPCAVRAAAAPDTLHKEQHLENGLGPMSMDSLPHARDSDGKPTEENLASLSFSKKSSLTRSQSLNVISVKEIVTGIESNQNTGVLQTKAENVTSVQSQMPKRNTVHELSADFHWPSENGIAANKIGASKSLVDDGEVKQNGGLWVNVPVESCDDCQGATLEKSGQDELLGHQQVAKWCPGSVRRATKEFEERLKQEHEQQPCVATALPTRKPSRADGDAAGDAAVTSKSGEVSPEACLLPDREQGSITIGCNELLNPEPAPEMLSNVIGLPLQPKVDQLQTAPGSVSAVEHRVVHAFETLEGFDSYAQLPKKIEIIEYTHIFKSATPQVGMDDKRDEKMKRESPATESDLAILSITEDESPAKENEDTSKSPGDLQMVEVPSTDAQPQPHLWPLLDPAGLAPQDSAESEAMTLPIASPLGEITHVPSECEVAAFDHHSAHLPVDGCPTPVLHLGGVTLSSTDTDAEIPDEETCHLELQDVSQGMARLQSTDVGCTILTPDDLERSFSRFDQSVREMQKMLSFSYLDHNLPHRCSNDSLNHLSGPLACGSQQAEEIGAKIRRAGLTTPSQMKRSASIAKLGCLELSTDELCKTMDPTTALQALCDCGQDPAWTVGRTGEVRTGCAGEEEPNKKKCVSLSVLHDGQTEQGERSESKAAENPPIQHAKDSEPAPHGLVRARPNLSQLEPSDTDPPCLTSLTPSKPHHNHHRNHPLKQIKSAGGRKWTASPLYNTM
ncbi:protein phosphatase Slingshot homolog 2 isoform X1 [Leucoraja erinacea]|uniref:protein phosphatase Slingshot homolog 2 isoform X1 n=1 Tax=Leucoraja erinaceus TaxID=7782 RepID=UPI0024586F79|nr:protein phosphatase Slingshot homolog 2 isoform X1 [Leucoraja erinacea]